MLVSSADAQVCQPTPTHASHYVCVSRYFAHLAKASDMSSDFIPPTVSQIRQVNVQLKANQLLPAAQLMELCKGTGIHEGTLKKVCRSGLPSRVTRKHSEALGTL